MTINTFEVINIKRVGKKVTIYIQKENEEFVEDLIKTRDFSKWVNEQIDKEIMWSAKGIEKKQEKIEKDIDHLQHEKAQLNQAYQRAKKIEDERKDRMKKLYQQTPIPDV